MWSHTAVIRVTRKPPTFTGRGGRVDRQAASCVVWSIYLRGWISFALKSRRPCIDRNLGDGTSPFIKCFHDVASGVRRAGTVHNAESQGHRGCGDAGHWMGGAHDDYSEGERRGTAPWGNATVEAGGYSLSASHAMLNHTSCET